MKIPVTQKDCLYIEIVPWLQQQQDPGGFTLGWLQCNYGFRENTDAKDIILLIYVACNHSSQMSTLQNTIQMLHVSNILHDLQWDHYNW